MGGRFRALPRLRVSGGKMKLQRRRFLQLAGAAALASSTRAAFAQSYPIRVVRLLVGVPPGGGADLATRIVSEGLSNQWKQQTIVENKPGAGARLAMDAATKAPPDGYTLLVAPGSPEVNRFLFSTLTFDPVADLSPISLIGTYPNIIAVADNSQFNKLEDFIAYAKANPGKVSWASPGVGTVPHLSGELFKHMTGLEMTHVPYRGMTDGLMTDLMTGRVDLMFNTTGSLLQPVKSGQLRGLAVTTATRFPGAPELRTVVECGVSGYDVSSWYALYAPAKTPADVIKKINADMIAILADPAVKQKFEPLGVLAQGSTPEQLAAKNAGDVKLWGPIIEEAHIRVE